MKKIIFCDIPMKERLDKMNYAGTGNVNCHYDKEVVYPINAILAEKLKKGDDVKVVLLKSKAKDTEKNSWSAANVGAYTAELDGINNGIGANICYEVLESDFNESKENHEKRYRNMLDKIEPNCEIYADITYGPKPLPMVLMCVMNFAEKFFDADIRNIIYGKVEFVKNEDGKGTHPANPELYDVTSLYYLNNLTNVMEAENGKEALEALDAFFAL